MLDLSLSKDEFYCDHNNDEDFFNKREQESSQIVESYKDGWKEIGGGWTWMQG